MSDYQFFNSLGDAHTLIRIKSFPQGVSHRGRGTRFARGWIADRRERLLKLSRGPRGSRCG